LILLFIRPGKSLLALGNWVETLTTILSVTAAIIVIAAFIALRPSVRVSPIPKPGAPLITEGIYKWISHPMYFAVVLFGTSMFISHINFLTASLLISLVMVLKTKASSEEVMLEKIHGKYKSSGFFPIKGI
jgi:protein-S-isoprenylcysteine O-methyltransferase Ste14